MLTSAELFAIRQELGYNLLDIGAVPYIGITQLFDQVIQPYLSGGAATTSSTTVTAATTATPATLVLASGTGFASGARIVVDVDDREEVVTAQHVSGTSLTALFKLAHSGTYPVIAEGPESMIREILRQIRGVKGQIAKAITTAGLKRLDVIEWYGATVQTAQSAQLKALLVFWRDQLAKALGVHNYQADASGGQVLSGY